MIQKDYFSKNINTGMTILLFGVLPYSLGVNIVTIVSPDMRENFNLDNLQIQYLSSIFVFFMGCGEAIFGIYADTYGRKITIFYGFLSFFIGSLFIGMSNSIEFILIGRALQGVAAAMTYIGVNTMIRDVMKVNQLGKSYALISTGVSGFAILTIYIGDVVVSNTSTKTLFFLVAILAMALAVLTHIYIPETIAKKKDSLPSLPMFLDRCFKIMRVENFFTTAVLCGSTTAFMGILPTIMPVFLKDLDVAEEAKRSYLIMPSVIYLISSLIAANSVGRVGVKKYFKINIVFYILTMLSAIYYRDTMSMQAVMTPIVLASITGALVWSYAPAMAMEKLAHKAGVANSLYALIIFVSSAITTTISIKLFKDNLQYAETALFVIYTTLFLVFGVRISQYLKRLA